MVSLSKYRYGNCKACTSANAPDPREVENTGEKVDYLLVDEIHELRDQIDNINDMLAEIEDLSTQLADLSNKVKDAIGDIENSVTALEDEYLE